MDIKPLPRNWTNFNWKKADKHLKRLRIRIFHAAKTGRTKILRSLQNLMLKLFYDISISIRNISGNKGVNTPGFDKRTLKILNDKRSYKRF